MKPIFTFLLTCMISLSLMGQQDIKEFKKQRYTKKHQHSITALEKKKSRNPEYASRHLSRQASSFRSAALKSGVATNQKMDSLLWELYDATNSEWMLSDRELFAYDGNGNMINYVWFAFDSVDMEILPYDKETVKYNAQGKPTEIIWLIWDKASGQWLNWGKYELSYDGDENLIQEAVSDWAPDGSQWLIGAQFDMTYDGAGNIISELWSFWEEDSAKLVLTYKDEYLYEDGKLSTWNEYAWEEGDWVLIFGTTYTYSHEGNLTEELTQAWESTGEQWLDFSKNLYSYNEANQLIMEEAWEFDWAQFIMAKSWQYDYVWDTDGNMIEQVDKSWDGGASKGTNAWQNTFKSEWVFNKDYTIFDLYVPYWFLQNVENLTFMHMPVSELAYFYMDGAWVFDFRQTVYYSEFGGSTGTGDRREPVVSIFPVPAYETITFTWDDQYARFNLELYDMTGKRVISRSIYNYETIRVDQLSGGIYFYKLTDNNQLIHSGKICVE
ncbi:MAG: T9SS type A sorting domain-containing protein [Bacteroidota bacterium]